MLKTRKIYRPRKPVLGYFVAAIFGFAIGATVTGNANVPSPRTADECPTSIEDIVLNIHGFAYDPELMPPMDKPVRLTTEMIER